LGGMPYGRAGVAKAGTPEICLMAPKDCFECL
jgi:hypothetical protein